MSDISAVNSSASVTTSNVSTTASSELGKYEFLKILAAELQNQDPTNPTSNTEFVAQLAQFSSLEQLKNMSDALSAMTLMQSAGLIGKNAVAEADGVAIEGMVKSVLIKDSVPYAVIGENTIPVSSITQIT